MGRFCIAQAKLPEFWSHCGRHPVRRWDRFRVQISDSLSRTDSTGILRSLIVGESHHRADDLEAPPVVELLRFLGFVHLWNATGVHLWGVYALWLTIGQWAWVYVGAPASWVSRARHFWRVLGMGWWLYAWALSGMRPGMLRPLLLIAVQSLGRKGGWRWRPGVPLVLALGVDGILDFLIEDFFAPGRWIYGLAVAGAIASAIQQKSGVSHFRLAVGSWIPTAFFEAWNEGWISWFTPIGSFLTTSLMCLVIYPSLLLRSALGLIGSGGFWPEDFLAPGMMYLFQLSLYGPFLWGVDRGSVVLGCFFALGSWLSIQRGKTANWMIPFFLVTIATAFLPPSSNPSQLLQKNVGQGDSLWWRSADGKNGMVDVGSYFFSNREHWLKFFLEHQIFYLDWVTITHWDEDHVGALEKIVDLIPIGEVISSQSLWETEKGKRWKRYLENRKIRCLEFKDELGGRPYPFTLIASNSRFKNRNQEMNLVLLELDSTTVYINPGDADRQQELRWLQRTRQWLLLRHGAKVILKAGHHGSKSSSSPQWVETLRPSEVWISAGPRNRYHHPHRKVLEELAQMDIPVRRTDQEGDLSR